MKAAIVKEIGSVEIVDVPPLEAISDYQCLCKNIFASTCSGTDRKLINNTTPWKNSYPGVLGHENIAEVIEIGAKVKNFQVGDTVLRPVYVYADEEKNGYHGLFGGFSEQGIITDYVAMEADGKTEYNPYSKYQMKVPTDWKNDPSSVMFITLKETFSWIEKLGPFYGKDVGIIGAGTVGSFYTNIAAIFCAKSLTVMDIDSSKFEKAKKIGADACIDLLKEDKPVAAFDILIDAAGIMTRIAEFVPMVKSGGTFAIYGIDSSPVFQFEAFGSGLHFAFHNSDESNPLVHETCIRLVNRGLVDLSNFHSSIMPFEEIPQAFKLLDEKKETKVVFKL